MFILDADAVDETERLNVEARRKGAGVAAESRFDGVVGALCSNPS